MQTCPATIAKQPPQKKTENKREYMAPSGAIRPAILLSISRSMKSSPQISWTIVVFQMCVCVCVCVCVCGVCVCENFTKNTLRSADLEHAIEGGTTHAAKGMQDLQRLNFMKMLQWC